MREISYSGGCPLQLISFQDRKAYDSQFPENREEEEVLDGQKYLSGTITAVCPIDESRRA
jgi:hypothetical protein